MTTTQTKKEFQPNQHVFYIKLKVKAVVKGVDPSLNKILISYFPHGKDKRISKLVDTKYLTEWKSPEQRKKKSNTVADIINEIYKNKKIKTNTIQIKYFTDIEKLEKIQKGDWIDLRAAETIELKQGEFKLINLGVGMRLPDGYEANVVPRSSTFKTWGVLQTNSYGVIDNSYSGNNDQWKFPAYATRDTVINKNDRICQFRIQKIMEPIEFEVVDNLDETDRGGWGSTGSN